MELVISVGAIAVAILVGAMSPGSSFFVTARTSVVSGRRAGFAIALGMGVGGAFFALLALAGLTVFLNQPGLLSLSVKCLGGAYLVYLGVRIWRSAHLPIEPGDSMTVALARPGWRTVLQGLFTQVANPKTAVVYAGIFAALLPTGSTLEFAVFLVPAIFLVEAGWYTVVAILFSTNEPRAVYLKFKGVLDRAAAIVIGGLGLGLIWRAVQFEILEVPDR